MIAPQQSIHDPGVLPALRELFSQYPMTTQRDAETLARLLRTLGHLTYRPDAHDVEAALEALRVEGGLLT